MHGFASAMKYFPAAASTGRLTAKKSQIYLHRLVWLACKGSFAICVFDIACIKYIAPVPGIPLDGSPGVLSNPVFWIKWLYPLYIQS